MIRKSVHKLILFAVTMFIVSVSAFAQYNSEDELKKAAAELFDAEDYIKALPLYSQLLSTYPKDVNYNYKYGACLLIGSDKKDDALKYLKFSITKSTVDPIAYYFLAKAYHHNYGFSAAIVYYNKFKEKGNSKDVSKYNIDREINMCKNGEKLVKSMTDIGVLSKKNIKATDFFRSYDLKGIGGKIVVKPDEFKTKLDKKNGETSIIYLGEKRDMVVFSSYGNNGSNGKDIFKVVKLPNGEWSKPSLLLGKINSKFDEDYPFLHPNGNTLYFCSKGFNSMGGYDVFKSTKDLNTGEWSYPENMDFPINTPDDDILYISDINNELAYFASARASKQGEMTVYRVTVDAPPAENSVIKGFFLAEANTSMKDATITIRDAEKDRRYGVYKTHSETGEYILVFPSNGGKYKLLVETKDNAPIHSATIELPVLDGFRALKQELRLVGVGENEKLVVKNLFDETAEFDIHDPLFVEHVLKRRAGLEVNTTEDEFNASKATNTNVVALSSNQTKHSKLTNDQIINRTDETASKLITQTEESKKQAKAAYTLANKKSNTAKTFYAESERLMEEANVAVSESEKQDKIALAEGKKMEAAQLVNETVAALNVAKTIDSEVTERKSDVATINDLQENINKNIEENNRVEAENNYSKLEEIAAATYHTESAIKTEKKLNDKKLEEEKVEYNSVRDRITELTNRDYELTETINKLEQKKAETKKKSEKEDLQSRIDALSIDVEDNKYELGKVKEKEADAKLAYTKAKQEAKVTSTVINDISNTLVTSTTIADNAKLQLENDIAYFEKEGLVGLYPVEGSDLIAENNNSTGRSPKIYKLTKYKDEYEIVNDEGELVDYSTSYSVELAETDNITNETQKALAIVQINQKWVENINQEIAIRENQLLSTTDVADKSELKRKLISLRELKDAKQSEIDAKGELIAKNSNTTVTTNEINESNTTATTNEFENNETTNAINNASSKVNILNTDGSIADYGTSFTEKLSTTSDEESYEAYTDKAKVHTEWAAAIDQEILIRKIELAEADESDKNAIENNIAVLENNKVEQEEYIALYNMQAESMTPTNLVSNENIENESENNTTARTNNSVTESNETTNNINVSNESEVENNNVNNEVTTNSTETGFNENLESNIIANNVNSTESSEVTDENSTKVNVYELSPTKLRAEEDEFSNLKYYEGYTYQAKNSQNNLENVTSLKSEARILKEEADVKLIAASNTSSQEEKQALITESDALVTKSNEKQEAVARFYENANKNEFNNNQNILTQLKSENNDEYSNQSLMIDLYEGEADGYYAEAQNQREKAINASSFTAKEVALQKAYELEMKAITKQNQAVAQLAGDNIDEIYANATNNNNNEFNENSSARTTNNEVENDAVVRTNNIETESEAVNNENEVENETNEIYNDENTVANGSTNNRVANNLTNENNVSENEIANNTSTVLSDQVTDSDKAVLMNLNPVEITAIKESEEFQEYATLKQENRRLVKEAEVEYTEAEIYEQEANDQKQLEVSLKALAAAASTDEDKAKKATQLEKLKAMINENETKSTELKQSAATKEQTIETNTQKTDAILIGADEDLAKKYEIIEKVDAFDTDLMTEAINRTELTANENNNIALNEQVDNNEVENNNAVARTSNTETSEVENNENESANANEVENETAVNDNTTYKENNETETSEVENNEVESNNTATNETDNITTETESVETNENETTTNEVKNNESVENENNTTNEYSNNNEVASNNSVRLENINEVPTKLENSIFLLNNDNQPVYNSSNPIPSIDKMPEGLVFKVQIGAFRNPIPQNHFKGFAPIMAEDAGNGITRYTAGLFTGINMAIEAKNSIRSIGYNDAFVVAFYNGERVSIAKAREMMGEEVLADNSSTPNNINNNTSENTNNQPQTEEVKDGVSTDVRNIEGVFYAIQVGVYSKPVTAGQLNNVSPLNSERLANGLIRYTSGVYKNITDANAAKNRIRGLGITDAFVVAYNGGQKIAVAKASDILASSVTNTNSSNENNPGLMTPDNIEVNEVESNNETIENNTTETEVEDNNEVETETTENNEVDNERIEDNFNENETTETEMETFPTTPEALNLEFKIKLGEYDEEVPVEEAEIFLGLSSRGVKSYEENNKTIYTIGSFGNYQSALDTQIEMKEMGVKNPKTIVFRDGAEISVEEALELIRNNK